METSSGVPPAVVKGYYCPDVIFCEVLQEHREVDVIGMQVMQVNNIGLEVPYVADEPDSGKIGEICLFACNS